MSNLEVCSGKRDERLQRARQEEPGMLEEQQRQVWLEQRPG